MKTPTFHKQLRARATAGFSLIELSMVMVLIVGLCVGMGIGVSTTQKWKKGKNAALALQAVYAAQRAYMADHPTSDVEDLTSAVVETYLPQGWSSMPVVAGLNGESLSFDVSVMPPKFLAGTAEYDPSGKSDDGLWDTGG
jgi:prepilin-type N-terminal cleavage/methylation domain-containing protein